ncbi:MAG TPA: hypothetical protein DEP18_02715 [Flavobacteriales bacterium]|nr:hypothetical protein [Flavobacteriales bacterium]
MIRSLILLFLLLVSQTRALSELHAQTYLVIRPQGHKVQTREMCISKDGKTIFTGDFDKTIIAWDAANGMPIREYLGQIGPGNEGMVYALALSPDNLVLAAGGWFGKDDESENLGDIRIYDVASGKIKKVIHGHANVINDLAFTADSKNVIAVDADGRIVQWNCSTGALVREYNYAKEVDVKDVFVNGSNFVTGDDKGNLVLWSTENSKPIKKDAFYKGFQIRDVVISPDGKWIACSGERFISVYNEKLKRIADIDNEVVASFLRFSPDSKKILAGCSTTGKEHHCNVFALENNAWVEYGSYDGHTSSVICGGFINDQTMVTSGGESNEIVVWTIKAKSEKAKVMRTMRGVGQSFFAAALADKQIAYTTTWTENFGLSHYTRQFDLVGRKDAKIDSKTSWNRPLTQLEKYSLVRARGGVEMEQLNSKLLIQRDRKIVDSIVREYWNGSRHNVFGFLPENWIVSGGSYGILSAYDLTGNEVSRFVGHEGDVWSLSVSADGKRMITASSDQTIRIWPLHEVGKPTTTSLPLSPMEYSNELEVGPTFKKVFQQLGVMREADGKSIADWRKVIQVLNQNDFSCQFLENKLSESTRNFIYPVYSLFISTEGEWVVWNQEGYFTSSRRGSKYVGYHINQGKEKEARFYPFEQFDLKYNRPDILLKDIGGVAPEIIEGYQLAYKKRLRKMGFKEEQLGVQIHIPEIEIVQHSVNSGKAKIAFRASDSEFQLERLAISINDVPLYGSKGKKIEGAKLESELEIELMPGRNKVQLSVINSRGAESMRETVVLHSGQEQLPELYLLSIGVSEYKDKKFNLRYAAKDANDISELASRSTAFSKVNQLVLVNEKVDLLALEKAKTEFLSRAKRNDVVMVFVAGNGGLDKDLNYFFASHTIDFNQPSKNGIPYEKLEELLDGLTAIRKILLMDTCHSGELDKEENEAGTQSAEVQSDISFRNAGTIGVVSKGGFGIKQSSQLATELFTDLRIGTGALVISSSGGSEYAMESAQWKNGLFTYSLLNGIASGKADVNHDQQITIGELQVYVAEQVQSLSGGAQQPAFRRENLEFDVRVW